MKRPVSIRGRGTAQQPKNRYAALESEAVDDGWPREDDGAMSPVTELIADRSRRVISYNESPDIPFDRSINPYRGCEHGCVYCYARPTHAWLDYSPGIDFETRILYKPAAADLLRRELSRPGYRCRPIGLGTNTDPWQPAERKLRVTRTILEVLRDFDHPLTVVTKSSGIERDIDILADMARRNLVRVNVSVTTLDPELARRMEPRAAAPRRRLVTIRRLADAGIPAGVIVAPIIPMLNDADIEAILEKAREAGAGSAHYILIRLPLEVAPLFEEWLQVHYPLKAERVMARIRDTRGGAVYQSDFGVRQTGTGAYADLVRQRFQAAWRRFGYGAEDDLDCSIFRVPGDGQLELFGA